MAKPGKQHFWRLQMLEIEKNVSTDDKAFPVLT